MNRHYTSLACMELMEKISQVFEDKIPFIGSDIIVGFPGETQADFEFTLENVRKSTLSNIHVFPYSLRKNTKAALMLNHLDEKTKQERSAILHKVAKEKYAHFISQNINKK